MEWGDEEWKWGSSVFMTSQLLDGGGGGIMSGDGGTWDGVTWGWSA